MKRLFLATVLLCIAGTATSQRTPSRGEIEAVAVGKLMALVHGANAYKTECAIATQSREHDRVFENWTGRNERLIDKVDDVGRSMQWFNSDGFTPSEAWNRMLRRDAERMARYIAQQIQPTPKQACRNAANSFEAGEFDLLKFPSELEMLGIRWP